MWSISNIEFPHIDVVSVSSVRHTVVQYLSKMRACLSHYPISIAHCHLLSLCHLSPAVIVSSAGCSLLDKDGGSQSSTDTAGSADSSPLNQASMAAVKSDAAHDATDSNNPESLVPDVSPRKKPRKQLL